MTLQIPTYGLSGGIGSGKSTVSQHLRERGECVIDADILAREVVEKGTEGLRKISIQFGTQVLTLDGELDRKALARVVFSDPYKKRILESITHPLIDTRFKMLCLHYQAQGVQRIFYEVPLLFELNMEKEFDATILVIAPFETRIARVMTRSSLSEREVRKRIESQLSDRDKYPRASYTIDNNSTLDELQRKTDRVLDHILATR